MRVNKGANNSIAVHDGIYDVFLTTAGKVSSVGKLRKCTACSGMSASDRVCHRVGRAGWLWL